MNSLNAIKIFIAYSREDAAILNRLRTNLKVLERTQEVEVWYDGEIEVGNEWEKIIKEQLHSADIILLLISENFIASDYCYEKEMAQALILHDEGKVKAIPIIAKECLWQDTPFSRLQALPINGKPLFNAEKNPSNYPYLEVVNSLKKVISDIRQNKDAIGEELKNNPSKTVPPEKPKASNYLWISIAIFAIGILSLFAFQKMFTSGNSLASNDLATKEMQVAKSDSTVKKIDTLNSFQVLLLPFGSSQYCKEGSIICERELKQRFNVISSKDSLFDVEINLLTNTDILLDAISHREAKVIGDSLNADLVIWGDYQSKCEWDSTKVRIKYQLTKDKIPFNDLSKSKFDYIPIADITEIEEGRLTGNIEDIIYFILALRANNIEKDCRKTIHYLQKIDKSEKKDFHLVYAMLGTSYLLLSGFEKDSFSQHIALAENYLNQAIKIDSVQGGFFNRAIVYTKTNRFNEAIDDYSKFIERHPKEEIGYINRGDVYSKLKRYDNSLNDYQKAIELNSQSSTAYSALGVSLLEMGKLDDALINLTKSISLNKNSASAFGNRAGVYYQKRNYKKAMEDINTALGMDEDNFFLHYNKGNIFHKLGKIDKAIISYSKAIESNPEFPHTYQNRSSMYFMIGDFINHRKDLKTLKEIEANNDNDKFPKPLQPVL